MGDVNLSMVHARRLELHEHPAPPAGAEVHPRGVFHEVQRGDGSIAIAREYSQSFHMDITQQQLETANAAAFSDGLQPGELLRVPGLAQRLDTMFLARNPGLSRVGDRLVHTVSRRDTLSNLARRYNEANDTKLTWQQLYAANRSTIGSNPDRLRVGQRLAIPGITAASPKATNQSLSQLDGDVLLTRTGRIRDEAGNVSSTDVMHYRADASHAEAFRTLDEAVSAARTRLQGGTGRSTPLAIAQTRDGQYQLVPLLGTESGTGDDSTTTLSLAYRADDRSAIAVADRRPGTPNVDVRRFDR